MKMLRNSKQPGTDLPTPSSPAPNSPISLDTPPRPRKKLSFKEPEIFNYLKLRKPSTKQKPPPLQLTRTSSVNTECSFDENPFEEENDDLDELESQAMRVVRTVGQAFEVCHKLSINNAAEDRDRGDKERDRDHGENHHRDVYEDQDEIPNEQSQPSPPSVHKENCNIPDISLLGDTEDSVPEQTSVPCLLRSHEIPATTASTSPIRQSPSGTVTSDCGGLLVGGELTALKHEIQLLRERLEQQSQQTRAAVAHARFLQDQLAAETAARVEAQARTHQLLVQNKELLEHIGALVGHLREQERIAGGHVAGQTQMPASATMQQTPTVPDLSNLGQCQRAGGQSSPWELDPPSFPYCSYPPESIYSSGNLNAMGIQGGNNSTDQLHFQTQLLERLHNISPYQPQRSPYATPSPYAMAAGLLLPPNNRPPNSAQVSPSSMSLRVSQANSFTSSPIMTHKMDGYGANVESNESQQSSAAFIRPLPCASDRSPANTPVDSGNKGKQERMNAHDDIPPIVLDPPPQGKKTDNGAGKQTAPRQNSQQQNSQHNSHQQAGPNGKNGRSQRSSLASMLRTPGPPPSRTTSARLPSRNDLMCEMQRTTWARHTTK